MKFNVLLPSLLAVSLAHAQSTTTAEYNAVCLSKDNQEEEKPTGSGHWVKYNCGKRPNQMSGLISKPGAGDINACIQECVDETNCKGSLWDGRVTLIASRCRVLVSDAAPSALVAAEGAVYMAYEFREVEVDNGWDIPSPTPDVCENQNVEAACSVSVGRDVAYKGKLLKVFGGAHWSGRGDVGNFIGLNITQCVDKCLDVSTCKSVIQDRRVNNGLCYLRNHALPAGRPEYTENQWNSVFIIS
ncbi:hypothetical protein BGW36DRAFT_383901 [Talaromyces proteolyticus]|uniref:Apple domain-containing protein n=1 Tax=Talaromyces proteolyticus TaxID=1131652 RepID=A0AAD4KKQ3_9EURO|nr:uncharacterized protein BGW36DRAFT_383901 [Talaromyces proteolyticus]KAH8693882.1 hypothetical protein BGW36DRAFT_383901 [Talaromyces proteolyticus]